MNQPKIDVRIPFEPDGKLGWDYNRIFNETQHDWVLVIDHDIMLNTCPLWYNICQQCIVSYQDTALFTCKTNAHHRTMQRDCTAPTDFDLIKHQGHARGVWNANKFECSEVPSPQNIAGFFMLISKKAWQQVDGFRGTGMFEEDWAFAKKLHSNNLSIKIMNGLYVMHGQKRIGSWDDSVKTSQEIYQSEILNRKK